MIIKNKRLPLYANLLSLASNNNTTVQLNMSQTSPSSSEQQEQQQQQESVELSSSQLPIPAFPILPDDRLNKLADTALNKAARQLQGELLVASNDYKLLEDINQQTLTEYKAMGSSVKKISQQGLPMRNTYQAYRPELEQIDAIVRQVDQLDKMAKQLDSYTRALELQVQQQLNIQRR
ncbi:biogenesis of lysosome-related organelles complex-1 subunit 2-domain-containing protein [Syncephalis fuscata]|nr:biogenesis of lysosome-related organelles complex-1 subunit 2-domain-containing protein [Syncephalis fuscata]